mmetsp:Transcript_7645/g.11863  ORF Transcript_7645/g.11863 Transcript_7645/m.11863 type:complete len:442 (-) Transcript_7645:96-1421(-)|eukprot:CAMPEP_0202688800 /NCGR_PEP_ID=MMETSP1385-20130828/4226_1 /ASSEMBLY_ACC=CAM_ASM_000861 /TAXON_ID=933848 /ORGANISM="Elphidium margaritaceum" /LENGTH=441 /DNA_ID=CAMNT_0049343841 /DNA_START=27 /DNA_END=1352 /DNA_ORIENTATION=+
MASSLSPESSTPAAVSISSRRDRKDNKSRRERSLSPRARNWKKMEGFELDHYSKPVLIDDHSMVIASGDLHENVYSYDFIKNQLSVLFKYPSKYEPFQVSTCFDHNKQKIYLYCTYSSRGNAFICYDIESGIPHIFENGLKDTGAFPVLCCLSGNIHLIGGRLNSLHLTWDEVNKKFTERSFRSKMIHGHAVIPLESTKQLLVLGGNDSHLWGGYLDSMWICDTTPSMKWRQLPSTLPKSMFHFGCIKTKDESKIVIFGGKTKTTMRDEIWILNLQTFEWTQSDVKCPSKGKFHAVKSRDGYVHLFEEDTKHYWTAKLSLILGTAHPVRGRSGSLSSSFNSDCMDRPVGFDDEKQMEADEPLPVEEQTAADQKPDWEYKVIEFHNECHKLRKQLKQSTNKIEALIQQNVKLNREMRSMEKEHEEKVAAMQKELDELKKQQK